MIGTMIWAVLSLGLLALVGIAAVVTSDDDEEGGE